MATVRRVLRGAALLLVGLIVLVAVSRLAPVKRAEWLLADMWLAMHRAAPQESESVVVIGITDRLIPTVIRNGHTDRAFLADLLRQVDQHHPAVIFMDIFLDEPSEAARDDALRLAIRDLHSPLVISVAEDHLLDVPLTFARLDQLGYGALTESVSDSVTRWTPSESKFGDMLVPSVARRVMAALGQSWFSAPVTIDWHYDPEFKVIDADHVADAPANALSGKVVAIGGLFSDQDQHLTPVFVGDRRASVPGLMIHARVINQLLASGP